MHSMYFVAFFASKQAGGSPAKCSTTNYARLNVNSVEILAVTSTSLLCERVCIFCLPLGYLHANRMFGLNRSILRTLPTMKSIPGRYSLFPKMVRGCVSLVDYDCARRASIALHDSVIAMEQYASRMLAPNPRAFDKKIGNPLRFMAIVQTPWFDRSSQELEWGFHCKSVTSTTTRGRISDENSM